MESRGPDKAKIARAAGVALTLALLLLLSESTGQTSASPALQGCPPPDPICDFDFTCGCQINCRSQCPPGGDPGGGGGGTPQPPGGGGDPTPPGGGGTPPPGDSGTPQPTAPPRPTATPPSGAGEGRYVNACILSGIDGLCDCSSGACQILMWENVTGELFIISVGCTDSCSVPTRTPPRTTPEPPPEYPCLMEPSFGGAIVSQPCPHGPQGWPGWDLSVSIKIPPVNAARNPWPRSIVGGETTLCFVEAPGGTERYSDGSARPCGVDRGEHEEASYACGGTTGTVGEGARVNFKIGVAWRRFTGANPGFAGAALPGFPSAWVLGDRDFNGGTQIVPTSPGQCTTKVYETSSFGLPQTGPKWNPDCQERECDYVERVQQPDWACEACDNCTCNNCAPAYAAPIQTWWWPEWTWRYDEFQCVRREYSECFYFDTRLGRPAPHWAGCGSGPHANEDNWFEEEVCVAWGWVDVIEPWRKYDMRRQGLSSPFWRTTRTFMAGMDENRTVRTPFIYSPSVPVIEVQPVHPE